MPRKIREFIQELKEAGFYEIRGKGTGKGAHRKFAHVRHVDGVSN